MSRYATAIANPDTHQRVLSFDNQIIVAAQFWQPVIDHGRTHIEGWRLCFAAVLTKVSNSSGSGNLILSKLKPLRSAL